MDFVQMLVDMGFDKEKAVRGLSMTGNKGVEAAMEWIFQHGDDAEQSTSGTVLQPGSSSSSCSEPGPSGSSSSEPGPSQPTEQANSIKCEECNKLFATQLEVEYHAAKSGHTQFSESVDVKKPLTEEEKKEQLKKLEERLKEKRKEREEKDKAEEKERERLRILSGKEMTEAKKRLEEQEMKKLVEQRKREKEDDRLARERIKKLIEADKLARKSATLNKDGEFTITRSDVAQPTTVLAPPPKDYSQTKIQIRLPDGSALTHAFSVNEPLAAVRLYVQMNRSDVADKPFSLMTTFPKKVFTEEEVERPLKDLGLVPSAVLIVSKVNS